MAFPQTALPIAVEAFISGAWVDITRLDVDTRVLGLDGHNGIVITRGRQGEQGRPAPTAVRMSYLDRNATLNGRNPASPYFRLIGRNTPVRVSANSQVRAVVELSDVVPEWDALDEPHIIAAIDASGILRRLGQGQKPLRSVAYRSITAVTNDADRVAYWPVEEESGADRVSSPYVSRPVTIAGTVDFGAYTAAPSSERMATFGDGGSLTFPIPSYTGDNIKVISQWSFPALSTATVVARLICTGAAVDFIDVVRDDIADMWLKFYSGSTLGGATLIAETVPVFGVVDRHFLLSLAFGQNGADLDVVTTVITDPIGDGDSLVDPLLGVTIGRITSIQVGLGNISGASFGQLALATDMLGFPNYVELASNTYGAIGYVGEPAAVRLERLCDEEGIVFALTGSSSASGSELMGAQSAQTLLDLLNECAAADQGLLFETRDALGLGYITRERLYNGHATPAADLTYGTHLSPPFRPATDDLATRNDVTASRPGGGSARYTIADNDPHHLTTQQPSDWYNGVGVYDEAMPSGPNVQTDAQLDQVTAWYAHIHAWAEDRFPTVRVRLEHAGLAGDAVTTAAVRALDVGDVIRIDTTDTPGWLPPDELLLLVQGYTEAIGQFQHDFTFNTTPALPYEVEVVDTGASTLVLAVNSAATSLKLATSTGPEWSTLDEPYYVEIFGEAMKVTAIVVDTPLFIAAGAASHAVNASVTPGLPAGMTIDTGQILLLKAAIRNSGTGVPNTPANWARLDVYDAADNVQWFYRYYATGYAGPTVTFAGGVAGADTSAQIYGFSGLSHALDGDAVTQLNGSAANIAYPALTAVAGGYRRDNSGVIVSGWRQQDWTSVATLAGFAELGEPDSGTGDNHGFVADFLVQATATTVPAGSFSVTGGVNGISRAATFALRPLQTATVERAINGVTGSIAAGEAVRAWRPGVNGL